MPTVLHPDPFNATLLSSPPPFSVSSEQKTYVREVLDIASSDSRFAQKAYDAITHILTSSGSVIPPVINSLSPGSATIGDPSFTLHVMGSGFTATSVIVFAGQNEPTTFVSSSELTTGVDMSVWLGADTVPVSVLNNDVMSDPTSFVFEASAPVVLSVPSKSFNQSSKSEKK